MVPKKGIKVNTDKKNDKKNDKKPTNKTTKKHANGGVPFTVAPTAATAATAATPATARRQPSTASKAAASTRPLKAGPSARPLTSASKARLPSARPLTAAASARPFTAASARLPSARVASYTNTATANTFQVSNNGEPPLPPGGGLEFSFEFECDNNETTKDMCNGKDGTDLEVTSSRLQQIIQQIIDELLAAPDALPPLNILMTQILVSFVVDAIQNALQKEQKINPTDKNIENLFKMASNIVLTSFVTTGTVPSASTIVIRVLVKRSMLDQKSAPSLPAMGKKLTIETFKQSKKILKKFNAFKPRMIEIIKNNDQQPDNLLTMQGIMGGSRPKIRNGGRKSRLGN
jgi:hypothetical protein